MECYLCKKHTEKFAQPPGGYIYQDEYWLVCHAPVNKGSLGTLFIESRRHLLDFAEMNADETASYGVLLNKVYAALKPLTGAERIYLVAMMEGIAHFHSWLVPRQPAIDERGVAFLAKDLTCELAEAEKLSIALRERLS